MLGELEAIRNHWAHQGNATTDDTLRALDTIQRLLQAISAAEQAGEVEKLKGEVMRTRFTEMQRVATDRAKRQATEGTPMEGLKPWREVITPHPDVCSGTFAQAEFAADLAQVHRGDARPEYGDPREFYRRTYLTEGLRGLLLNAIARLSSKGGQPVIELQTNFGGGKTHSMLALYHLVSGLPAAELSGVDVLMTDVGVTTLPSARRAVLVGTALSAGQPETTKDGLSLRTLWGRMAYQLGGADAFALIAASDASGTAPGSDDLVRLFKHVGPCLILIDEWVAYCRQMYGTPGLAGGSFDANLSFAQSLTEAVKAVPGALLVASLPQSAIEVGGDGGAEALARLESTFGRLESNWRPANAEESYEIVRRRLFEPINDPALFADRDAVVRGFGTVYRQNPSEFPSDCKEAPYERRMEAAYPIHPELFDRLYNDWSSLEEFQRTRGVLRLMAAVIHTLWARQDRSLLILPSFVPIDEPTVETELTRYLSPNWQVIIEKDVDGPNSLPRQMDETPRFGRHWAARRVARTIYLGSAPVAGRANRGLDIRRVRLGCVQPGENIAVFGDALRQLGDQAAHLYADGSRYWYATQPNVGYVARDRAAQQEEDDLLAEIIARLRKQQGQRGGFAKVYAAPESTGDVPDEPDGRLVILSPDKAHVAGLENSPALIAAMELLEKRGNGQRLCRNTLVFLAADKTRLGELKDACAQYRAWRSIHDEREPLGLDPFNTRLAEKKVSDFDGVVESRLPETFQWLIVPEQQELTGKIEWQAIRLASGTGYLAPRAFVRLERDGLILSKLSGIFLRRELDRVLWVGHEHVGVRQVQEYFAQYLYLPRLTYQELIVEAVRDGVASLTWRTDTFAYAGGYDVVAKRYLGLQAGRSGVAVMTDGQSVLVRPDAANEQLVREAAVNHGQSSATASAGGNSGNAGVDGGDNESSGSGGAFGLGSGANVGGGGAVQPPTKVKLTHFHGSISVEPAKLATEANRIAAEILQHLLSKLGSQVEVVIDISASLSDGVDDQTQRIVTENCRTLRFDAGSGFEP